MESEHNQEHAESAKHEYSYNVSTTHRAEVCRVKFLPQHLAVVPRHPISQQRQEQQKQSKRGVFSPSFVLEKVIHIDPQHNQENAYVLANVVLL
jgi:hypothetical protein